MTLSDKLRAANLRASHKLLNAPFLTERQSLEGLALYLHNVTHLTRQTPRLIRLAVASCDPEKDARLVEVLEEKEKEEQGHEVWGEQDARRLRRRLDTSGHQRVVPAMDALIRFLEKLAETNPAGFLAYINYNESQMVAVGPKVLQSFREQCGVTDRDVSILARHVELDVAHADDGVNVFDELNIAPELEPSVLDVPDLATDHFVRVGGELLEPALA